jgi:hypothetical protein
LELPFWLEEGFLYRLNYGPASSDDIMNLVTQNGKNVLFPFYPRNVITKERVSITLLDRKLAARLRFALFNDSVDFLTDTIPDETLEVPFSWAITPFDYPVSAIETFPLIWVENFVTYHVWNKHYSSSILGEASRPSMAAVVMDFIDMVNFFKSIDTTAAPRTLEDWLAEFYSSKSLKSSRTDGRPLDGEGVRNFLADMFSIVACVPRDGYSTFGPPCELGWEPDTELATSGHIRIGPSSARLLRQLVPGVGLLFSPSMPPLSPAASHPSLSLEDLDASFIQSGPFQFQLTNRIEQHLTLDSDNHVSVYKSDTQGHVSQSDVDFTDHPFTLRIYDHHVLKRFWHSIHRAHI